MRTLKIRKAFFYELQHGFKKGISYCRMEIFRNGYLIAYYGGSTSSLQSNNDYKQVVNIIPIEGHGYSILHIHSKSKKESDQSQSSGDFFLVENFSAAEVEKTALDNLSFLDEGEYDRYSDSFNDSEFANIDSSQAKKHERNLSESLKNKFIEITKGEKKTPKLNIQKITDISQIDNFRDYYLDTEERISQIFPEQYQSTFHDIHLIETITIGCYFGSVNGKLNSDAAYFINEVVEYAEVNKNKHSETEINLEINERKLAFVNLFQEHFIDNKEYDDFHRRVRSGELYTLEIFKNMEGGQIHQYELKLFFSRLATKVLSVAGFDDSNQAKSDLEIFIRSLFGEKTRKLTGIVVENALKAPQVKESSANESKEINFENLDTVLNKLNSLVGLQNVKTEILELINFLKIQKLREERGLQTKPLSRHFVFYGNPGTGKTTVARLLSQIFHQLGILSKGHLVETDRSGLVAGYVGQTALKVSEVVNSAIGGILFIDEAYSLNSGGDTDFGQEAIDTLIKLMEDNREDLIVIVAGYPNEMEGFVASNPGLRSRFNRFLLFNDYDSEELVDIFLVFAENNGYSISDSTKQKVSDVFTYLHNNKSKNFSNARLVRNLFEKSINNQANRIVEMDEIDEDSLSKIEQSDIPDLGELSSFI
jgi:stage V sporulation protein K